MKLSPVPSPRGTNFERIFMLRVPEGTDPKLALDAALRAKDRKGARDDQPDLSELRAKLDSLLRQVCSEDSYATACDMLDDYLPEREPQGKVYGTEDAEPDEAAESLWPKYPDHSNDDAREYLKGMGLGDDDVAEIVAKMPKTGMESMNAAIEDRRRGGGRDRRRGAAMDRQLSAADSFEAMFHTSRIKMG
jgi:hypothetical protein